MLDVIPGEAGSDSRRGVVPAAAAIRRLVFGGVGFELLAVREEDLAVDPEDTRFVLDPGCAEAVADVTCAVTVDPSLPLPLGTEGDVLRTASHAEGLVLEAAACRVDLTPVGAGRYAASARIAPGPRGQRALLRGLAAIVLEREGGATLHAAGVEVDGRAVLFLGPSGAGKSTAARLTTDGRSFADDHVALVPTSEGWIAWGLPGGSPAGMPASRGITFPVARLLRVRRGRETPAIEASSPAAALFAVRGAVESSDCLPEAEAARLSTAARIAREIEVATIHTVLGHALPRDLVRPLHVHAHRDSATHGRPFA